MGKLDSISKTYMEDVATFADAFNFQMFGGEQVVRPEALRPLDTALVALPYGEDGVNIPVQRFRDVAKVVTAMTDDLAAYLLLAIENQSNVHNAMPVRTMLYDALQYAAQVAETAASYKEAKKPQTGTEFLSGFRLTDKLLPVITLTLHFGSEKWDAPRDLHGMLSADERIMKFIPNYWIHLLSPAEIQNEDFSKFRTELGIALKYIKYSNDGKELLRAAKEDPAFQNVSKLTVDLINDMTNSKLVYPKGKEKVDMCKAIQELIEEGKREAEEKAAAAEEKLTAAEEKLTVAEEKAAMAEKRALTAATTTSETIALNFLRKGIISQEEIAENTGLALARVEELAKALS